MIPCRRVATHPRRIRRHSRERQADRVRSILEQSHDRTDRHVSLEHVTVDDRRVARRDLLGNAHFLAVRGTIRVVGDLDLGAVLLQVHDPPRAAASTGIAPDIEADTRQLVASGFGRVDRRVRYGRSVVGSAACHRDRHESECGDGSPPATSSVSDHRVRTLPLGSERQGVGRTPRRVRPAAPRSGVTPYGHLVELRQSRRWHGTSA